MMTSPEHISDEEEFKSPHGFRKKPPCTKESDQKFIQRFILQSMRKLRRNLKQMFVERQQVRID